VGTYTPTAEQIDSARQRLNRAAREYPNADYTPFAFTIGTLGAIFERVDEDGPERTIQRARAVLKALSDYHASL
jgi:hypothetical protein